MALLDHVALVVRDVGAALARLDVPDDVVGPIEEFPREGTREVYVGRGSARLLLLQPIGDDGPYARALRKRGPGLHHVALRTGDLEAFLSDVRGWLLHPISARTIADSRTAWLARPGVPTLVEVQEGAASEGPALVTAVEVPGPRTDLEPAAGLSPSPDADVWITLRGRRVTVASLADGPRS